MENRQHETIAETQDAESNCGSNRASGFSVTPQLDTIWRSALPILLVGLSLVSANGCRLCADCDLDAYPSYGGAWQRTVRDSGRVGSLFDPGGSRVADLSQRVDGESVESELRQRNADEKDSSDDRDDEEQDDKKDDEDSEDGDVRDRNLDDDLDLKDMENRLRDLDLQDINYYGPDSNSGDWH